MPIDFDPEKSRRNPEERGLPFERAEEFDLDTAIIRRDTRHPYPEVRLQALGLLGDEVCFMVFTRPAEGTVRVISLRKASRRERQAWNASRLRT